MRTWDPDQPQLFLNIPGIKSSATLRSRQSSKFKRYCTLLSFIMSSSTDQPEAAATPQEYLCTICEYAGRRIANFTQHMNHDTHIRHPGRKACLDAVSLAHGIEFRECPECSKVFSYNPAKPGNCQLRTHTKQVHRKEQTPSDEAEDSLQENDGELSQVPSGSVGGQAMSSVWDESGASFPEQQEMGEGFEPASLAAMMQPEAFPWTRRSVSRGTQTAITYSFVDARSTTCFYCRKETTEIFWELARSPSCGNCDAYFCCRAQYDLGCGNCGQYPPPYDAKQLGINRLE